MLSGASKMVFDPRRCKKSSTSTSTVRRGGLSTKKHETSDYPVKSHNSPTTAVRPVVNDSKEPLGTMALHCRNDSQSHWGQWLYTAETTLRAIEDNGSTLPKQLSEPLRTMALHWPKRSIRYRSPNQAWPAWPASPRSLSSPAKASWTHSP